MCPLPWVKLERVGIDIYIVVVEESDQRIGSSNLEIYDAAACYGSQSDSQANKRQGDEVRSSEAFSGYLRYRR